MSITDRQKKIINPYAETLDTPERNGVGYDYNNRRNRFVQDAIHERYIYFFQFPKINDLLRVKAEDNIENPQIEEADLLAYFALYPQNGMVVRGEPMEIGDDDAILQLEAITRQLSENEVIDKYTSRTSEVSYLEEYQSRQGIANLIAIPAANSNVYRNKLRQAFDLPKFQYSGEVSLESISLSPRASTYVITDTNVDLYDWRQNCLPGDKDKTYYNTVDRNYYFTRRTDEPSFEYLNYNFNTMRMSSMSEVANRRAEASALWENTSDDGKSLYGTLVGGAIREILQSVGKYSTENYQNLVERYAAPTKFVLYTDLDRRPGSRWTYAVKIDGQDIENLPSPDSLDPSKEETEISTLEKAKRIISDANQSVQSVQFQVEDLIRYIFFTRNLLREYDKKLFDINLGPEMLDDIDLPKEVDRLNSFFSLLELFYNYNKISIQDTDYVQMYFTKDYKLDHIIVNGSFYYQGTGGRTYLNEEVEAVRVINAFGIFTPTTFSIIKNSQQIYNESKNTSSENRKEVLDFMSEYLFPKIDLESIKKKQSAVTEIEKRRSARRKKVFETYSRLTKGNPEDFEFLYSNRPLKYTISSTLSNMDCDSGQAAAAQYALKFWQAATSKTRLQSVIREAIILIRDEVVEDETTKRRITQAAAYAENPDRVSRDIERYINEQIFCSLDVIGDFIEDQFLDPLGLPPQANRLTRNTIDSIPKIEFKKCSMTSSKARQSVLYQKMLETILLSFIKSIIAGIAKDFIKALLGCGPNNPNIELSNSFRKEDYGFVDLTELLYGIDIVEIANLVGLQNIQEEVVDGNISTERTPATKEQLEAFISDISKMCTPVELQQLLNGDGSNDLLKHLLETTDGTKDIQKFNTEYIDVDVYNTFNLGVDRIRNYFIAIGNALDGTLDNLGEMGFVSPLEAYCNKKDGFINPLTFDFSVPEIEAQYNDIISSKINKINNLCSFLRDLTNIELEIQRLIESLPVLGWYNDLLDDIASLSNQFFEWLSSFLSDLFAKEQQVRQQPEYNLYNSSIGTELFYQIFFSLREILINQIFVDPDDPNATYFQTPAGFNGTRVGFRTNLEINLWSEDDVQVKGNFGARKNEYTRNNVYKFIWSDPRTNNTISPNRINIPQYRNPPVPPNDYLDASYYSIRNSPEGLIKELKKSPNYLSPSSIGRIQYGEPRKYTDGFGFNRIVQALGDLGADNDEIPYLAAFSNRVYNYLKEVENKQPYEGWTGATYLRCANTDNGNIKILYNSSPEGQLDEVSSFRAQQNYNEVSLNSTTLAIDKQNYNVVDYRVYSGIEYSGSNIAVDNEDVLIIDEVKMPYHRKGGMITLYSNYSIGLPTTSDAGTINNTPLGSRMRDIIPYQNYTTRIDTLINNSVINDIGKRRMPRYIAALNKPSLQKTDDICVTAEDILKGEAGLRKVQANLFSFFMNIMPMASAYPNWRSGGTVEMITDYLTRKLIEDLKDKQILGSFYELIPFIRMVYPHIQNDEEFNKNPLILDELPPLENTRNIIKSVYVGTLDNISETSEYGNINKSSFDPSTALGTYKRMLGNFYRTLYNTEDLQNYIPAGQDITAVREELATLYTGNNPGQPSQVTDKGMLLGTYYFPIAFQIASYMIYMDRGIRYSQRFVDTNYRMLIEEAATDDSLLTANKGQLVEQFTPTYAGFPVKITGWGGNTTTYYNSTQASRRIITLDQINNSFQSEEGFGYLSLNQLLDLDPGTLAQAYPDFFSIDALIEVGGLYRGRRVIPQNQVEEIRRQTLNRTWTLMSSLKGIINNTRNNRQEYVDDPILSKFVGSGPPITTGDGLLTYFQYLTNEYIDDARYLLSNFEQNNQQVLSNIETFQQDLPENIGDLIPTIRTDSLYFQSLGDIFRGFGQALTREQNNVGNAHRVTNASQFSPYFIAPDPYEYDGFLPIPPGVIDAEDEEELRENIRDIQRRVNPLFSQQIVTQFRRNQAWGHAQRFFYEYLYNKYANYRTDQVKILQEKNQLEKLINRNE